MRGISKREKGRKTPLRHAGTEMKPALRLGGVYALPNGTELVVGVGREGRYILYHLLLWKGKTWIISMPIEYEVGADGRVTDGRGQPACWMFEDLVDTGQTLDV